MQDRPGGGGAAARGRGLVLASYGCLVLAAMWPFGQIVLRLVDVFVPVMENPVDLTWVGFAVFAGHSLAALVGLALAILAVRRAIPRTGWKVAAVIAIVIGGLAVAFFLLLWWGTAFVEAFPWQDPLP